MAKPHPRALGGAALLLLGLLVSIVMGLAMFVTTLAEEEDTDRQFADSLRRATGQRATNTEDDSGTDTEEPAAREAA